MSTQPGYNAPTVTVASSVPKRASGAATIGVAAPVILVVLRLLQGFAVGGEWAGAALLCAENSPRHRRGRSAMFLQLGVGTALVLANVVFLLAHSLFGDGSTAFMVWGWRVPFLLSAVLIAVGLYVRMHLEETAEFADAPRPAAPGSSPTPTVEIPMTSRVIISVRFLPMRSPKCPNTMDPTGRATNAVAKVPSEATAATVGLRSGKNTVGNTRAAAVA